MSFRADESADAGREGALQYLISRHIPADQREESAFKLSDLIIHYGPVVESYPFWHPLVASFPGRDPRFPATTPSRDTGYEGLDHTVYLRNAFITCPYGGAETVIESIDRLEPCPIVSISAEELDFPLYMPNATPVLVKCEWDKLMLHDGTFPPEVAVPLLLELEVPCWRTSRVAETWETMRPYILGSPRGKRSSLFINQETGQVLKTLWNTLINTGMFGPIKVGGR